MVGMVTWLGGVMGAIREFHSAFTPELIPSSPAPLGIQAADRRAKWVESEARELVADTLDRDILTDFDLMAKQADAFIDAIYFAAGGLMEMGLDPSPLFGIVHGQNMAKMHERADGSKHVVRRESDGKVVKPEGWVDPHAMLVDEIRRQVTADAAARGATAHAIEHFPA